MSRDERYQELHKRLGALLDGEEDWVSAMATVACELHHAFERFHWTGFYRVTEPGVLRVGPYQGGHGCLQIPFERGVCGAAAREARVIRLDDVEQFQDHIACSATTRSEIVVPIRDTHGRVFAVLDVDSDHPAAFDEVDERELSALAEHLGTRYGSRAS